jgi:hypothetical protein
LGLFENAAPSLVFGFAMFVLLREQRQSNREELERLMDWFTAELAQFRQAQERDSDRLARAIENNTAAMQNLAAAQKTTQRGGPL